MKTISKKQFEIAVQKVLSGGKSCFIVTNEVYPFSWNRSKGYCNLRGSMPQNSKFIGNTGRGGAASDLYLVCYLASGSQIVETKAETKSRLKAEAKKAEAKKTYLADKKQAALKAELLKAESLGLAVKDYRNKLAELFAINKALYAEYEAKKAELLSTFEGRDAMYNIVNRVKFSRLLDASGIEYKGKSLAEIL